jgi:hypothetical protein
MSSQLLYAFYASAALHQWASPKAKRQTFYPGGFSGDFGARSIIVMVLIMPGPGLKLKQEPDKRLV